MGGDRKLEANWKQKISFCCVLAGAFFLTANYYERQANTLREYTPPPKGIEHFAFGHQNVMADSLWLRAIQDFDFCEKKLVEHTCKGNSWLFQVLDVASDLSPTFAQIYDSGGLALSVIISDIQGATKIFDKGLAILPHDWTLAYKAACHFLLEEHNKEKAAKLLELAARNGAPTWVYATATKLYTESGQRELAVRLLDDLEHRSAFEPKVLALIRERVTKQTEALAHEDVAPADSRQPSAEKREVK